MAARKILELGDRDAIYESGPCGCGLVKRRCKDLASRIYNFSICGARAGWCTGISQLEYRIENDEFKQHHIKLGCHRDLKLYNLQAPIITSNIPGAADPYEVKCFEFQSTEGDGLPVTLLVEISREEAHERAIAHAEISYIKHCVGIMKHLSPAGQRRVLMEFSLI